MDRRAIIERQVEPLGPLCANHYVARLILVLSFIGVAAIGFIQRPIGR